MATKDFVDYSPASGSNNGSIDITVPRNLQTTPRSTAIVIEGEGLSKTIAVNQNAVLPTIGDFGRNSTNYGLWTTIHVDAIGIKGIAYCTMVDSSVIEKELNNTVNIVESEYCRFVSLKGRRVNDTSKVITFNMQTTLDFIGRVDTLCELFTDINFNSTKKNTQLDVIPFYESLVYDINDYLMTMYPNNYMLINFNIVDFDEATKERIRSMVTCDRFAVVF
jgi:hypothetical protein